MAAETTDRALKPLTCSIDRGVSTAEQFVSGLPFRPEEYSSRRVENARKNANSKSAALRLDTLLDPHSQTIERRRHSPRQFRLEISMKVVVSEMNEVRQLGADGGGDAQ